MILADTVALSGQFRTGPGKSVHAARSHALKSLLRGILCGAPVTRNPAVPMAPAMVRGADFQAHAEHSPAEGIARGRSNESPAGVRAGDPKVLDAIDERAPKTASGSLDNVVPSAVDVRSGCAPC